MYSSDSRGVQAPSANGTTNLEIERPSSRKDALSHCSNKKPASKDGNSSITQELRTALNWMLEDLESCRLRVTLGVAPEPQHPTHMIRVVDSTNPEWYRDLCELYTAGRTRPRRRKKHDTLLKRRHIAYIIKRLISHNECNSKYTADILDTAKRLYKEVHNADPEEETPF